MSVRYKSDDWLSERIRRRMGKVHGQGAAMMQGLLTGGAVPFTPPDPFAHYMDVAPDPDDPFNTAHCDGCGADILITTEGVRQASRQIHRWCKHEEVLV